MVRGFLIAAFCSLHHLVDPISNIHTTVDIHTIISIYTIVSFHTIVNIHPAVSFGKYNSC